MRRGASIEDRTERTGMSWGITSQGEREGGREGRREEEEEEKSTGEVE